MQKVRYKVGETETQRATHIETLTQRDTYRETGTQREGEILERGRAYICTLMEW